MYYNYKTERIYVSCGGGKLDIIKQKGPDTYQKIVNMTTRPGARTALLVPALHLYLLAEPTFGNKKARLMVYRTK